jgi:ABC-type nickel/cobalt efflux system permease component RcnA
MGAAAVEPLARGAGRADLRAMDMHAIAEFEWAILLGLVLLLALWELWRTRRAIRRARERERE